MTEPLFAGLKVIDCASYVAAPAAATVLADFGAEVIKIEPPVDGDAWRNHYKRPGLPPSEHNHPWLMDARNKRGLALDLKSEAGRAVLERLLSTADVFITNLPLPVRERLRVRYADFAEAFPRLIYASLTAYGEAGEEAGKTGFDATAYWARSGLMDEVRPDHRAIPARSVAGMGDRPTAMALYGAIVTALYRREKTGLGGEVRASLLASGMWANGYLIQARLCGVTYPPRPPREEAISALGNLYHTLDDRWFMLVLANDRQWPALAKAVGMPELVDDPRFLSVDDRRVNAPLLTGILDMVFARKTLNEWRAILDAAGLTFGVVGTVAEIAKDPQALAAGILRPLAGTGMMTVDSPFTLTGSDKVPVEQAPEHGEHSRAILRAAGYSDAEISDLRAAGVIAGPQPAGPAGFGYEK
jgi:crotonobetainyl-CoA:carnitine CoA-transferase CaiB-like acyl-CoA transferase